AYTTGSITSTFLVCAATFGSMTLFGLVTKKDLSGWGKILILGLIGIIIASIVNLFLANSTMDWVITYLGVIIFVGLTAYDTQKLKNLSLQIQDETTAKKLSIMGALTLYLDFINLFLYLLKILGKRK
ncbi:MAG: Bax inhibitor-1/YccA family protein, partial [Paludibacteraceae bacterium]